MTPLSASIALLLAGQVAAPPVVTTVPPTAVAPLPPHDWSAMPLLRVRRPADQGPETSAFVQSEVTAGRCASATLSGTSWTVRIDFALLAAPDGRIRRITPRAIDCATVEQYAAGLLLGTARDNIDMRGATADTWYRTSMTFTWSA